MRDYQFGEWIAALRIANGYSQFQLGKLLGISDKAVSKWENGAAKPRMDTCARMASLFGISLDDLLSCREHQESSRLYSAQSESEEELWQEAREKLRLIYGDNPPIAFQSRLDAEEVLMKGTGMIRHLKLEQRLSENDTYVSPFARGTTLTSWLMGCSEFNPLQPHTVCPHCRKTVLHPEVKDGWDLPESICTCGTPLIRDGHDIRLDLYEKKYVEMQRSYSFKIYSPEEPLLRKAVQEIYGDAWKLIEYDIPDAEDVIWVVFGQRYVRLALIPSHATPPFPYTNGVYHLPDRTYDDNLFSLPEVVVYINIAPLQEFKEDSEDLITWEPCIEPPIDELLKPDLLESARKLTSMVPSMLWDYAEDGNCFCADSEFYDSTGQERPAARYFFEKDDISSFLPERFVFSDLVRYQVLNDEYVWNGYLSHVIKDGQASLSDVPASQDELFDAIVQKLIQVHVFDRGIALRTISHLQQFKITDEDLNTLSSLGFEQWLIDYVRFLNFRALSRKETLVSVAHYMLCEIADRKSKGINENEYQKKEMNKPPRICFISPEGREYFKPPVADKSES